MSEIARVSRNRMCCSNFDFWSGVPLKVGIWVSLGPLLALGLDQLDLDLSSSSSSFSSFSFFAFLFSIEFSFS